MSQVVRGKVNVVSGPLYFIIQRFLSETIRHTMVSCNFHDGRGLTIYKTNYIFVVNLQLCQLAEFHEITGFAIRVHEDNKRLLRIKLQEDKVTFLDN